MSNFISWLLIVGVIQIIVFVVIVGAIIGLPILILRALFGRHNVGGPGGSSPSLPTEEGRRPWGFPTSFYTGNPKLSNFKVDPKVYDFSTPKLTPDLGKLRKPANIDMDLARGLFTTRPPELPKQVLDLNKARELFLPGYYPEDEEDETEDSSFS